MRGGSEGSTEAPADIGPRRNWWRRRDARPSVTTWGFASSRPLAHVANLTWRRVTWATRELVATARRPTKRATWGFASSRPLAHVANPTRRRLTLGHDGTGGEDATPDQ